MSGQQNTTIVKTKPSGRGAELSSITHIGMLSPKQLAWVDYCTVQGVITNDDGSMTKMSIGELAQQLGVNRTTLYNWRDGIPNFWDFVAQRRGIIFGHARVQKAWNTLYLKATVDRDVKALQTFLANADPTFRMPAQKVEVEAGNSWAALMNKRRNMHSAIDGEVVDESSPTN